jgi:PAS domain S-box-containing protein
MIDSPHPAGEAVITMAVVLAIVAIASLGAVVRSLDELTSELRTRLTQMASVAAASIDGDLHRRVLEAGKTDSDDYLRAVHPLRTIKDALEDVKFVYTLTLVNDRQIFVLNPTPSGDADGDGVDERSYVGDVYDADSPGLDLALGRGGRTPVANASDDPVSDQWGTFISGYAPIRDSRGDAVGVVGVDMTLDRYLAARRAVVVAAMMGMIPGLLATFVAGGAVYVLRSRHQRLVKEQAEQSARLLRSEEQLRTLVNSAPDFAIYMLDTQGRIASWNTAAERLTGYTESEAIGRSVSILHGPGPDAEREAGRALDHASRDGVFHVEGVRYRKDGSTFMAAAVIAPMRDTTGVLAGYCKVTRDISAQHAAQLREREAMESLRQLATDLGKTKDCLEEQTIALSIRNEELSRAREVAEGALQAKSAFLANVSHELRTPMSAILGFTDLISEPNCTPDERREYAQIVRSAGDHFLTLINDLLDFSKIEAGRMSAETLDCDHVTLISDVCSLMRKRAEQKGLVLNAEFDGEHPLTIRTDPTRLRQIVTNLVGNAVKFTENGGVRVLVRVDDRSGASLLMVDVIDTGIGLTEAQQKQLFVAFSQADESTTRKFGGTGLGLTISRAFARMLGGDVKVFSTPGEGSTFRVRIACGDIDAVPRRRFQGERASIAGATDTARPEPASLVGRVLLAEDGPDNQRLFRTILTKAGIDLTIVDNGQEALDAIKRRDPGAAPFDMILMDMQMPVMDGYTATAAIRAAGYAGPILALTAHALATDRAKCIAAGCTEFLTKPVDRRRLLDELSRHLPRRRVAA